MYQSVGCGKATRDSETKECMFQLCYYWASSSQLQGPGMTQVWPKHHTSICAQKILGSVDEMNSSKEKGKTAIESTQKLLGSADVMNTNEKTKKIMKTQPVAEEVE